MNETELVLAMAYIRLNTNRYNAFQDWVDNLPKSQIDRYLKENERKHEEEEGVIFYE